MRTARSKKKHLNGPILEVDLQVHLLVHPMVRDVSAVGHLKMRRLHPMLTDWLQYHRLPLKRLFVRRLRAKYDDKEQDLFCLSCQMTILLWQMNFYLAMAASNSRDF